MLFYPWVYPLLSSVCKLAPKVTKLHHGVDGLRIVQVRTEPVKPLMEFTEDTIHNVLLQERRDEGVKYLPSPKDILLVSAPSLERVRL